MSKTLSNGTLSLRFMQNAQRAKQQAQVELEQAKIKDEAEWEVSQEVRDAWGIGPSPVEASSSIAATHESSYLPFLFEERETHATAKPKGRRTFDGDGKEVIQENRPETQIAHSDDIKPIADTPKRTTSISGFKVPIQPKDKGSSKTKPKTAQQLIHEDVRIPPSAPKHAVQSRSATGFVKPAGVDGPSSSSKLKTEHDSASSLKRDREGERDDSSNAEGKKRRKKKDVQLVD